MEWTEQLRLHSQDSGSRSLHQTNPVCWMACHLRQQLPVKLRCLVRTYWQILGPPASWAAPLRSNSQAQLTYKRMKRAQHPHSGTSRTAP